MERKKRVVPREVCTVSSERSNHYHMMRLFRQEVGQTIHNYLCDRRLIHARDLISQGLSATESCFRSGFRSYSSFTRAYSKRFGTTPTGRSAPMEDTFEE